MPILNARVPEGAFSDEQRATIVADLTEAIAAAEQIPDDPIMRSRIIVIWEEIPQGRIYANAIDVSGLGVPVFLDLQPPEQALTEEHAAEFGAAVEAIFQRHASEGQAVLTSLIMSDVTDGRWAISGEISRIADFARTAGYAHLQHLVS